MNSENSAESFKEQKNFLLQTLRLKKHCNAVEDDLKYKNNGGKIVYLVDSNIMSMFTAPTNSTLRLAPGGGIYSDDGPLETAILTLTLARHIFFSIDEDSSSVGMFPKHGNETNQYWHSLDTRVSDDLPAADKELRKRVAGVIVQAIAEDDAPKRKKILEVNRTSLIQFLIAENSEHRELERLERVLNLRRVVPFQTLVSQVTLSEAARSVIKFASNTEKWTRIYQENQISRLIRRFRKKINKQRLEHDVDALTTLFLINQKLKEKDINVKLVLITRDSGLLEAAEHLEPSWLNDPGGDESGMTFAKYCLRHPVGYLALPELLTPGDQKSDRNDLSNPITEWLDGFISRFSKEPSEHTITKIDVGDYNDLIHRVYASEPGFYTEAKDKWKSYKEILINGHTSSTSSFEKFLEIMFGVALPDNASEKFSEVDLLALPERRKGFVALEQAMMIGGIQLFDKNSFSSRNPPPLIYGRFQHTNALFDWLVEENTLAQSGALEEYTKRRDRVAEQDDSTGYAIHTICAMVFAVLDKWDLVASVANRAIEIAEGHEREDRCLSEVVTGREAYYLKSVATRHKARNKNDYDDAQDAISKAFGKLEVDNKNRNKGEQQISTLRFEAERSSITLAKLTMELVLGSRTPLDIEKADKPLAQLYKKFIGYKDQIGQENDPRTEKYLYEKGFVSTFMIAFLCEEILEQPLPESELCRELTYYKDKILKFNIFQQGESTNGTGLFWTLHNWCLLRYDQSQLSKNIVRKISANVEELKDRSEHVSEYDRERARLIYNSTSEQISKYLKTSRYGAE